MNQGPQQLTLSFPHAEIIPRGDGTFLFKPGKPIQGREEVTIAEAVRRFGASHSTWLRLYDSGFIQGERKSPRKITLYVDSIQEHLKAASDREFWTVERRARFFAAI